VEPAWDPSGKAAADAALRTAAAAAPTKPKSVRDIREVLLVSAEATQQLGFGSTQALEEFVESNGTFPEKPGRTRVRSDARAGIRGISGRFLALPNGGGGIGGL
jgi:hypothetical protein